MPFVTVKLSYYTHKKTDYFLQFYSIHLMKKEREEERGDGRRKGRKKKQRNYYMLPKHPKGYRQGLAVVLVP